MVKCKCYRITKEAKYLTEFEQGVLFAKTGQRTTKEMVKVSRCTGTKECDICSCEGDRRKCDFYPENRKPENVAKYEKEHAPKFGEWISVFDKLPPIDKEVLVWTISGQMAIDYRYSGSEEISPTEFCNYSVAFWQPLPERPKELQGDRTV